MKQPDDETRLRQMLSHAVEAVEMMRERTRLDLDANRQLNLAVVRLLEILGEAAGRVSVATREKHVSIPWAAIIGMRNRLIHGYDEVDLDIVWQVIQQDLTPLIQTSGPL